MRYLLVILIIVGAATGFTLLFLKEPGKTDQGKIALTINGHQISENSVSTGARKFGYHAEEKSAKYKSIITKQLLIEEAKKQVIDKEESFRKALKDYYESSLVKILLERKNEEIVVSVSEEEIDRFISFSGTIVSFTRLKVLPENKGDAQQADGINTTALFDDLADSVKLVLFQLTPGEYGIGFDTGHEKYAIRLDSVTPNESSQPQSLDREYLRLLLEDYKREQEINLWLTHLIEEATITIHSE